MAHSPKAENVLRLMVEWRMETPQSADKCVSGMQ